MSEFHSERSSDLRSYVIGYGFSLLLTWAAFAAVYWQIARFRLAFGIVAALGLLQMVVQFRYFLHVRLKRSAHTDLLLIIFSTFIILLMVSGTLVVLFNLRSRMM